MTLEEEDPSTPALPPLEVTLEEEPSTCSVALTLEELPRSSVGAEDDEVARLEEDDSSVRFSSPAGPFAEPSSPQATRPIVANEITPNTKDFLKNAIKNSFRENICFWGKERNDW